MRTNYEAGSMLYEEALAIFLKEQSIWIGLVSFLVFYPLLKKMYKKEKIESKSINYSILPILILEILMIALFVHFLNIWINKIFLLSNRYLEQQIVWNLFLSNVILGPILEEYLFRGIVFERLKKKIPNQKAMFITSLCFALMHIDPLQMFYAFVVGFLLNYVYKETQNINISIFIHCLLNGFFFFLNPIFGQTPFYLQLSFFLLGMVIVYLCQKRKIHLRICKKTLDKNEEMI